MRAIHAFHPAVAFRNCARFARRDSTWLAWRLGRVAFASISISCLRGASDPRGEQLLYCCNTMCIVVGASIWMRFASGRHAWVRMRPDIQRRCLQQNTRAMGAVTIAA